MLKNFEMFVEERKILGDLLDVTILFSNNIQPRKLLEITTNN